MTMKKLFLNLFSNLLTSIAIINVNTACSILYGQEKEPESLCRLKKHKN